MHATYFIQTSFHRPCCDPWCCWQPSSGRLLFTKFSKEKKSKVKGDRQEWGRLSSPRWPLHSEDTVALRKASRALMILQREVRERLCTGHVTLFSLVILYTMYKEHFDRYRVPSVSMSHARVCAKIVEHCLDELWEIIIVLPAPVLPCIRVIKVHWPTVSWK